MRLTLCWCIISSLSFFEVQGSHYKEHYAEYKCRRDTNDAIEYSLSPSGQYSAAIIKATRALSYSVPFNCNITVSVANLEGGHVLLSVRKVTFPWRTECANYIKVYEGEKKSRKLCSKYDVPGGKLDFTDSGKGRNAMKFLYHTETYAGGNIFSFEDDLHFSGFEVLATAYTTAPCGKELSFLCNNGRCISRTLRFDGYDNCGDGSDESVFSGLSRNAIIGICIAILLTIAAISGIIYMVRRRRVTKITTYTAPTQPLCADAPRPYPQQTFVPYPQAPCPPYPQASGVQDQYGIVNPHYGQPPPPYQ